MITPEAFASRWITEVPRPSSQALVTASPETVADLPAFAQWLTLNIIPRNEHCVAIG
jgi:hypothetical protein